MRLGNLLLARHLPQGAPTSPRLDRWQKYHATHKFGRISG
jgi:hypothetical protein